MDSLHNVQKEFKHAAANMTFSEEFNVCLELEFILQEAAAPVYMYDKIMKWAIDNKARIPSSNSYITRKELLKRSAMKVYGNIAEKMKPIERQINLPSGNQPIIWTCMWNYRITTFNIYTQIATLLSDTSINEWKNYFFSPTNDNPFSLIHLRTGMTTVTLMI